MDREQTLLFGETALARGFVTREQLNAALAEQRAHGAGVPLGAVMVNLGFLSLPQATGIEKLNASLRRGAGALGADDDEPNVVGLTLGGCLIVERIATGSMGTTYRAHHLRLDRDVAVKVLHPRMVSVEGNLERFAREARSAANLEHPAIVSVYDFDSDQGYHFIVMQYVKGQDLRQVLEGRGALGPRRAMWIGARVLEGLQHAHAAQIVHRDIKPANLLITPEPRIKIADFGLVRILSRSTSEEVSAFGEIIGTPQYMAPEQAMGDAFDHRADLYALGITLFELVAGRPPYTGNSTMEVLEKHIMEPLPSIRSFVPEATTELETFLQRMCAKAMEDRYANAAEALAAVQAMRFTAGVTRRLETLEAEQDPSRKGESPAIVTEAALNELKQRLRQSRTFVAFEAEDLEGEPDSEHSDVAVDREILGASFAGVEVVAPDALAEVRGRLRGAKVDPERLVPALLKELVEEGRNDELIALARELEGMLPTSAAVAFYLGRAFDNRGLHEQAREKFSLATVFSPDHLQARLHLARVLVGMGRADEAVAALEEATTWHPNSVQAVVRLAEVLYVVKQDREAAIKAYERAIELAPNRWQLRQQLAWILYELRHYERAERILEELVAWRQDAAPAKKLLAQVRKKRARRQARVAKKAAKSALPGDHDEGAGERTGAFLAAIRLASAGSKWEKALEVANRGLVERPDNPLILLARADALRKLGRFREAVEAYGLVLSIDPSHERAQLGLVAAQEERRATRRLERLQDD
jgi:serine/threonine protein kinase/Flp pilus assembly protein TadD